MESTPAGVHSMLAIGRLWKCSLSAKRRWSGATFVSREAFAVSDGVGALDAVNANAQAVFCEGPSHNVPDGRSVVDVFDRIVDVFGIKIDPLAAENGRDAPVKERG